LNSGSPVNRPNSILDALGGPLGIAQSLLPGAIYVTIFSISQNVLWSAVSAGSLAFAFLVWQLIRRKPLTSVIAGLIGLLISVYLPLRDGFDNSNAADYFLPGFFTNSAYLGALLLSVLLRYPLAGFVIGLLSGTGSEWRKDKSLFRRYNWITLMWATLFSARLLVQVPLYLTDQVTALGITKLAMGTPLYALLVWFTWLLAREALKKGK
jgi:hypothetical protein